ncbi:MAG TPA: sterol desaturase family protein [Usitatibacter sp.]|nr:sterol desaturase family protein [Usitatibacter sp.]
MAELIGENAWLLAFWGAVAFLGALEFAIPEHRRPAHRGRRWPANFGLGILNGLIASVVPVVSVSAAQWAATHGTGLLNVLALPWWAGLLCVLTAVSGAQYALHRAFHAVPILWKVHRVHHSDIHLDVSSALRFHPVEMIAVIAVMAPVAVILGLPPILLAGYEMAQSIVGMVTHSNLRLPGAWGRMVRAVLVTPRIHRIHHSTDPAESNRNFANVFVAWDRWFGTYEEGSSHRAATRQYGLLDVGGDEAGNLAYLLELPFHAGNPAAEPRAQSDL